jgi:hypothetical protein
MLKKILVLVVAGIASMSNASAQENGPTIIPEQIQRIAAEYPVADRLGIEWGSASPEQIGKYMGLIAAVNEAAKGIALKNGRETPSDSDFRAAFSAWCIFPPNKPPLAESHWPQAFRAFGNEEMRQAIRASIGPLAVQLSGLENDDERVKAVESTWPKDSKDYFDEVINLKALDTVK